MENISQAFAREVLGEERGRSVSQILADNLGISKDAVHLAMVAGALLYIGSKKR